MADADQQQAILIVGDWVVDEYWFLVSHHSETSSHVGSVHYRVSSAPDEIVRDLCGAGHVARALYQRRERNGGKQYALYGLGNWHSDDTTFISHLVHARLFTCEATHATYRLTPDMCAMCGSENENLGIKLVPLNPNSPTIRVVRQYHYKEGGWQQLNRVDWEPEETRKRTTAGAPSCNWDEIRSKLPAKDQVKIIIVHDLMKGAISDDLICRLRKAYPDAHWYVRSKYVRSEKENPPWLNTIKRNRKKKLALLVIGPEEAASLHPWESWLSDGRIPVQVLETVEGLNLPSTTNVILLSGNREVVARLNDSRACFTAQSYKERNPTTQLGWPDAFYASLIYETYDKHGQITEDDIREALVWADENAGVLVPNSNVIERPDVQPPRVVESKWATERDEWTQAMTGCGIIKSSLKGKDPFRFEVWRGSTHLPHHIACTRKKQEIITLIRRRLRAFVKNSDRKSSLSILLQADPGSGKTFLAKCLAEEFGFVFHRHDVTQMAHRDELQDLFDTVDALQTDETRPVLVFVDEINAILDGSPLYGAFLTPLEEGIYMRHGRFFSLKPCVWIFAGTNLDADLLKKGEKLSDFKSRMTLTERIDFASLKESYTGKRGQLVKEAKLEQVYLGVTMIRHHFPDVQWVSREVLEQFHRLDPAGIPTRRIRRLAAALHSVQYGRVTRANCGEWSEIEPSIRWICRSGPPTDMVKLIFD